jgi:uncharacterized membrane protein
MLCVSVWGVLCIPAQAEVPIHFDLRGQPDGFGGKWFALLISPAVSLLLVPFFLVVRARSRSPRAVSAIATASLALQAAVHLLLVLAASGRAVDFGLGSLLAQAFVLLVVGNYLPAVRRNRLLGIRTPWTLRSELAWRRTHSLGGRLFFALGLVVMFSAMASTAAASLALIAGVLATTLVVSSYSYFVAKSDPQR